MDGSEPIRIKTSDAKTVELAAGTPITVMVSEDGDKTVSLESILVAYRDNGMLIITAPKLNNEEYEIDLTQPITFQCYLKSAVLTFNAGIVQKVKRETGNFLVLKQTQEVKRIQRRQNFRLQCQLNGFIEYTDPEINRTKITKAAILDISGGGTSAQSSVAFAVGDRVHVHLPLGKNNETLRFPCEVRRCVYSEVPVMSFNYSIGLLFDFEDMKQQEMLIAQLFKMESKRAKTTD